MRSAAGYTLSTERSATGFRALPSELTATASPDGRKPETVAKSTGGEPKRWPGVHLCTSCRRTCFMYGSGCGRRTTQPKTKRSYILGTASVAVHAATRPAAVHNDTPEKWGTKSSPGATYFSSSASSALSVPNGGWLRKWKADQVLSRISLIISGITGLSQCNVVTCCGQPG